jgi:hypothetical protein
VLPVGEGLHAGVLEDLQIYQAGLDPGRGDGKEHSRHDDACSKDAPPPERQVTAVLPDAWAPGTQHVLTSVAGLFVCHRSSCAVRL